MKFLNLSVLTTLFFYCSLSSVVFGQTVTPLKEDGNYYLQMANVYFEVDPSVGGKISSLKINDDEVMFVKRNGSLWGSTFWTSPQSDWNWPPADELDKDLYTGGIKDNKIILESAVDNNLNVSFKKTFYADLSDTSFTIIYTIRNEGSSSREFAPWEVTRVPSGGLSFFGLGDGDITGSGLDAYVQTEINTNWYPFDESDPSNTKLFSDATGWIAHVNDNGYLFIKSFEDVASKMVAPTENEIEIYLASSDSYIELENQGAYKSIPANDELTWQVKWYVRSLPDGVVAEVGNQALVDYTEAVIAGNTTAINYLDKQTENDILFWPNPTNDMFSIDGLELSNKSSRMKIVDISGKIVKDVEISNDKNQINVSLLTAGVYTCMLDCDGKYIRKKLVISN